MGEDTFKNVMLLKSSF